MLCLTKELLIRVTGSFEKFRFRESRNIQYTRENNLYSVQTVDGAQLAKQRWYKAS